jgi:hypothetical protein
MRKLALAGIAGVLLGAGAVVALASSRRPTVTLARPAGFSSGSPAHPQGVKLAMRLGWTGYGPANQPMVTRIDVWFPRGTHYNGAKFPKCSAHTLSAAGPRACPKGSIMGNGGGSAFADTVVTHPQITVVNGGPRDVYFFTVLNNPARVQTPVDGHISVVHGQYAYHLSATIPQILRVVAGVPVKLTELNVNAGRGKWLTTTAPPNGIKIVSTFSNGAQTSSEALVSDT